MPQKPAWNLSTPEGYVEVVRTRPAMYVGNLVRQGLYSWAEGLTGYSVEAAYRGWTRWIEGTVHTDGSLSVASDGDWFQRWFGEPGNGSEWTLYPCAEPLSSFWTWDVGLELLGIAALSERFELQVRHAGRIYQRCIDRGTLQSERDVSSDSILADAHSFAVRAYPDRTLFEISEPTGDLLRSLLETAAYFIPAARVSFHDQRYNLRLELSQPDGLASMVRCLAAGYLPTMPMIHARRRFDDLEIELAMQYYWPFHTVWRGFWNQRSTPHGGEHLIGFRAGVVNGFNTIARKLGIRTDNDPKLTWRQLSKRLCAVVSVLEPRRSDGCTTWCTRSDPHVRRIVQQFTLETLEAAVETAPECWTDFIRNCWKFRPSRRRIHRYRFYR